LHGVAADLDEDEVRGLAESDAAAHQLLKTVHEVIAQLLDVAPKRRKDDAPRPARLKAPKQSVSPLLTPHRSQD
jgi:hypothetical protein